MNHWGVRKLAILSLFIFSVGCSDTTPSVSMLRSIQGFDFLISNVVTASMNSVPLNANCSAFVGKVEMSFDGGTTWEQPSDYDSSVNSFCQNGSFAITLKKSKAPWDAMTFTSGQVFTMKFRAQPKVGDWIYRDVSIKYVPSTPKSQEILAGSVRQSGSGYVLHGKVRGQMQHTASSSSYVLRGRITQ